MIKFVIFLLLICLCCILSRSVEASSISGCNLFPSNNIWNYDISNVAVDSNSANFINNIGTTGSLKADFGAGLWDGGPIGIPFVVVPGSNVKTSVSFTYADESDPGPYPIPSNPPIEGGDQSTGDRHILMVDKDNCILYELYSAYPKTGGGWDAGSGAIWSLNSNNLRPAGWTSADAAGLPILPGLVRYDEVATGNIDHALRFTVSRSQKKYIWPARHQASSNTDPNLPPMGLRLRLKNSFNISSFSANNQVILKALKKYGMIVADNGSNWYISGVPDERWNNDDLALLRNVKGSDFEVINEASLQESPDSGKVLSSPKPGDINGDGLVNVIDYGIFVGDFPSQNLRSDIDHDGRVTVIDYGIFVGNFGH